MHATESRRPPAVEAPADSVRTLVGEALRSPARPLATETRAPMDAEFGYDFSRVRIHEGLVAARSAAAVGARAYTIGRDIVLGPGVAAPEARRPSRLLRHELAHVVGQDRTAEGELPDVTRIDPPGATAERAAEQAETDPARALRRGAEPLRLARQAAAPATAQTTVTGEAARQVTLVEEDGKTRRTISAADAEFSRNYIDYNIADVGYWSTPYASTEKQLREFYVNYDDGRQLTFSLDEVPARYALPKVPGYIGVRAKFKPQTYFKRGGFIYPDILGEGSIPRLIDIATTIRFNHMQREKFLEIATVTFQFAMILTAYAAPPSMPTGIRGVKPIRPRKFGGGGEAPPPVKQTPPGAKQTPLKKVPESGTPGVRRSSAASAAEREAAEAARRRPVPANQQAIRDALLHEHPGLNPKVATEAAEGGSHAAGAGGAGADVPLLAGGGREVSVHAGRFTPGNIGGHLQGEAAQAGTTEIYLQLNSQGATRQGLLAMIQQLRVGYRELNGLFIRFYGPNGERWWSGVFRGPP